MNPFGIWNAACAVSGPPRSPEAMREPRRRSVARLLHHAYRRAAYYRRLFDEAGVNPSTVRGEEDLLRIPVTTKKTLRAQGLDALADGRNVGRLRVKFTTGSSGEPFRVRRTYGESLIALACWRRCLAAYGAPTRMRTAAISIHGASPRPTGWNGVGPILLDGLQGRRLNLDCRRDPDALIADLERFRPHVVVGYAGVLATIGVRLRERGSRGWRPRFLVSGSELLTPLQRAQIRAGFGAPVYDFYGALEAGPIAWECVETGLYHVANDHVILGLEHEGRPVPMEDGARGDVIVTNLHAWAMPFIRYRLEDTVTFGPTRCPCGAPYSTLRSIDGRWMDYFILADGRRVHPLGIADTFICDADFITQYQLVQERRDLVVVRAVVSTPPTPQRQEKIERGLCDYVGPGTQVRIEWVDRIDPEPSGKYKLFVSRVPSP